MTIGTLCEVSEEMVTCRCRYLADERRLFKYHICAVRGYHTALGGVFKHECSNINAPPYALLRYFCGPSPTTHTDSLEHH